MILISFLYNMQYSLARIMRERVDTQCIVRTWVDKTRQTVSIQGLLDNRLDKARNLETVEISFCQCEN